MDMDHSYNDIVEGGISKVPDYITEGMQRRYDVYPSFY